MKYLVLMVWVGLTTVAHAGNQDWKSIRSEDAPKAQNAATAAGFRLGCHIGRDEDQSLIGVWTSRAIRSSVQASGDEAYVRAYESGYEQGRTGSGCGDEQTAAAAPAPVAKKHRRDSRNGW